MVGSRRQFLAGVGAGVPLLLLQKPEAQAQSSPSDPVLDAMIADLAELTREGNASPAARKGVLRAAEALTGAMAVHLGQHYDGTLKSSIRRLGVNRQAFVQDVTTRINKPEITPEKVEAALRVLEKDGLKGALLRSRQVLKRVRENAPEVLMVKRQFDFCAELRWMVELQDMIASMACLLSLAFGGTNIAADLACAAMTTDAILLHATAMWFGC